MKKGLLFLLLCFTQCARCHQENAVPTAVVEENIWSLIPENSDAAVVVPSIGVLGQKLSILARLKLAQLSAQLQGFSSANEWIEGLTKQWGVDIRSQTALQNMGLRSTGSAAWVRYGTNSFLFLPIASQQVFSDFIEKFSLTRLGTQTHDTRQIGALTLHQLHYANQQVALSFYFKEAWVVIDVSRNSDVSINLGKGLAKNDMGKGDLVFYFGSQRLSRLGLGKIRGTVVLSEQELKVHADSPVDETVFPEGTWAAQKGISLSEQLPRDVFFAARVASPAVGSESVGSLLLGEAWARMMKDVPSEAKGRALANVAPGTVLGLSLSPDIDLGGGVPELSVRRTNPFHYVELSGVIPVNDSSQISSQLDLLMKWAPKFGAKIEKKKMGKQELYLTSYSQGEGVHFAAVKDRVIVAAPKTRLEKMILSPVASDGPFSKPLNEQLNHGALSVVVDIRRLVQQLKALPDSSWGLGGFAIRGTAERWLDAITDMTGLSLVGEQKEKKMVFDATLYLELNKVDSGATTP